MSFSKFFRKKIPDPPSVLPPSQLKVAQSLDNIKSFNTTGSQIFINNGTMSNRECITHENQMDDISVHLAALKYSSYFERRSQLFKSLKETLRDKDALAYFIQFLDTTGKSNLVKFCLNIHAFRTSFTSRLSPTDLEIPTGHWSSNLDDISMETSDISMTSRGINSANKISNTNGEIPHLKTEMESESDCVQSSQKFYSGSQKKPDSTNTLQECYHNDGIDGAADIELDKSVLHDMENDAMLIFKKYFSGDSRHRIDVSDEIRDSVARRVCSYLDNRITGMCCFDECELHVYNTLDAEFYPSYLQSPYHCKHQLDILTGNSLTITDIIYHVTSLSYFTEFMEQNKWMDYLQCYLDVDNFHLHLTNQRPSYNSLIAQEDAMIIYDKFLSMQASRPLNFCDGVRLEVEGLICREGGPLPDCFLLPRSLLLYKMEQVHFPLFLKSDLYYKYLVDLINTVHSSNDIPGYRRKRTGSDASSEKSLETISSNSISSRNTLLAVDTKGRIAKKGERRKVSDNMQIDGSLLDPNNLWHRPNTGMKFGHVNSLGQFIPEFEPEPDHKIKKLSFVFPKKNTQSDEDLAIQVAQQILQDVNILTSYGNNPDIDDDNSMT